MQVVVVAADPDRAEAFVAAARADGHDAERMPASFARAVEAMNKADAAVVDFADDAPNAAWCLAYALARGRLAVACARPHEALPFLVRDNPSPYQRIVVGETETAARELAELLRL